MFILNSIPKRESTKDFESFNFLNKEKKIIEEGWNYQNNGKLWLYNLHYFDFLNQLTQGTNDFRKQNDLITDWINKNPIGFGVGFEPYPTSIRIVNWIKWIWSHKHNSTEINLSLWNQVWWLSHRLEYHILGNHLFTNIKALLFASVFFNLDESSALFRKAIRILNNELDEQFLSDGGHFELSPMYHALALEDLIEIYQFKEVLPKSYPHEKILERIINGFDWLYWMSYSNNELPHFNDSANGIAHTFIQIQKLWLQTSEIIFPKNLQRFRHLRESGYAVIKDSKIHLIADIGEIGPSYLPGHGHADVLSFELAYNDKRIIVNSGSSLYDVSNERIRQRSTSAHSTIEVDYKNSSDVWSSFRVGNRAKIIESKVSRFPSHFEIYGKHDGYTRIKKSIYHERKWKVFDNNDIEIIDSVSGIGNEINLRFFLHPKIKVISKDERWVIQFNNKILGEIISTNKIVVNQATFHPEFGTSEENTFILIKGKTPFKNRTLIRWN